MIYPLTQMSYGALGLNIPVNTNLASIPNPGIGRFRVWGQGWHTLSDGLKLVVGGVTIITISGLVGSLSDIGPVNIDITNGTDTIDLKLAVATQLVAGAASGTIYAQRWCSHLSEHSC